MATVLIVDDQVANRLFLVKLLGYGGHRLLEASDGADALTITLREKPDLIISDILMPSMDGYEFVRRLRDEPAVAGTIAIFYTATYHQREAAALAKACGVAHLLIKPSKPEVILSTVNEALGQTPPATPRVHDDFRTDHLSLLTDTVSQKVAELEAANLRLSALVELSQQLAGEHHPLPLLEKLCKSARDIIGAKYAVAGILSEDGQCLWPLLTSGLDAATVARMDPPSPRAGVLAQLLTRGQAVRRQENGQALRLSGQHSSVHSFLGAPLQSATRVLGVIYLVDKLGAAEFTAEDEQVLLSLGAGWAVAHENARLFAANAELYRNLQQSNLDLALAYDATLEGWVRALDLRDKETEGHTKRVTETTLLLANAMGLKNGQSIHIRRGALLHDIGKIGIPDRILLKPGPLDDAEWEVMRRHPVYAYQMLSPIRYLQDALDIPYCHHEKWDGSGYPRALKDQEIPLAARVFAVVDVWDALANDRPYRAAWPRQKVLAYIGQQAGKHFDPDVVEAFADLKEIMEVQED